MSNKNTIDEPVNENTNGSKNNMVISIDFTKLAQVVTINRILMVAVIVCLILVYSTLSNNISKEIGGVTGPSIKLQKDKALERLSSSRPDLMKLLEKEGDKDLVKSKRAGGYNSTDVPEALAVFIQQGYKPSFRGVNDGLAEYILVKEEDKKLFYVPVVNTKVAIAGIKLNSSGKVVLPTLNDAPVGRITKAKSSPGLAVNVSRDVIMQLKSVDRANSMLDNINRSLMYIPMGDLSLPPIYVITDPSCVYCMKAWKKLIPLLAEKRIHLRVLFGGKPGNAYFYAHSDPVKTFLQHEISRSSGNGGLDYAGQPIPKSKVKWVDDVNKTMLAYGVEKFPSFLYRDKNGKVKLIQGYSEDILYHLGLE